MVKSKASNIKNASNAKNTKAQTESMIFWLIFGLMLLAIGLYVLYAKYNGAGNSALKLIFGR